MTLSLFLLLSLCILLIILILTIHQFHLLLALCLTSNTVQAFHPERSNINQRTQRI